MGEMDWRRAEVEGGGVDYTGRDDHDEATPGCHDDGWNGRDDDPLKC